MLIALFAAALISQSPTPTATPEPTEITPVDVSAARVITARAPTLTSGPTRVVCSRERSMDSNIQRRVCRRVPVYSNQRERMASDMLKDMQRLGRIEGD